MSNFPTEITNARHISNIRHIKIYNLVIINLLKGKFYVTNDLFNFHFRYYMCNLHDTEID